MKAKPEAKAKAIKLRTEGLSIKEIARTISCSSASVCRWVSGVEIGDEQKKRLASMSYGDRQKASKVFMEKSREAREKSREGGRQRARLGEAAHAIACSLYWAEGTKKRNHVSLANTDPELIKIFFDFLVRDFDIKPKISFSYHQEEGNAPEVEAREFWALKLGVNVVEVNSFPNKVKRPRTGLKRNRHRYGMCILDLSSTHVAQHIYGALEVYGNVRLCVN